MKNKFEEIKTFYKYGYYNELISITVGGTVLAIVALSLLSYLK